MSRIYCKACEAFTEMGTVEINQKPDGLSPFRWGDIACTECSFVIATVEADIPGNYIMLPIKSKEAMGKDCSQLWF